MVIAVMNTLTIRIRYSETDQMGRAYYANHFVWFEAARSEYFRKLGLSYKELEKEGLFLPVLRAECDYKHAVSYDDIIKIECGAFLDSKAKIKFEYNIKKEDGSCVATGKTLHVFINKKGEPLRIPEKVSKALCKRENINTA